MNFKPSHTFDQAKKITKVEVIISKDEWNLCQTNFYCGDELLVAVGEDDNDVKEWAGRRETFEIAENEKLIGCELNHSKNYVCGITWLKMKLQ